MDYDASCSVAVMDEVAVVNKKMDIVNKRVQELNERENNVRVFDLELTPDDMPCALTHWLS
jgi:exosome complex RNA-binding protein Csl4